MSVTQIWTAFLATLATLFMAGMLLLSDGQGDLISQSERPALRAVANATMAALEAQVAQSKLRSLERFANAEPMQKALNMRKQSGQRARFHRRFRDLAYQGPLADMPELSLALLDRWGDLVVEAGVASQQLRDLGHALQKKRGSQDKPLSFDEPKLTTIGGTLYVIWAQSIPETNLRILGLAPLRASGASTVRRVLGTSYASVVMQGDHIAMELADMGSVTPITQEIHAQRQDMPTRGLSEAWIVGQGADRRLAVIANLQASAGLSDEPLALLVLSPTQARWAGGGLFSRLSLAWSRSQDSPINWTLLIALWLAAMGVSFFLPRLEWMIPAQRLRAALESFDTGHSADPLVNGEWNRHWEPLVAAIGRRSLATNTQRSYALSTASRRIGSGSNELARPAAQKAASAAQTEIPVASNGP